MTATLVQRTDAWREARRSLVTATDIPVLLGLSPYRCEADLADEKMGVGEPQAENARMRIGTALEPLIASEYALATGRRVERQDGVVRHPSIPWAAASLDALADGGARVVELKWTGSRSRFASGLPQDVEAQVAWQLGCSGIGVADVAVLTPDGLLPPFEVAYDPALFADLVAVAEDFRRRLDAGGPFASDAAHVKRSFPSDNGAEMVADGEIAETVRALVEARDARKRLEADEEALETSIKRRMGEFAALRGDGFHITWKRTRDGEVTDWKSLASGLLDTLPETDRTTVVGLHTSVRPGFRPFRLVLDRED